MNNMLNRLLTIHTGIEQLDYLQKNLRNESVSLFKCYAVFMSTYQRKDIDISVWYGRDILVEDEYRHRQWKRRASLDYVT